MRRASSGAPAAAPTPSSTACECASGRSSAEIALGTYMAPLHHRRRLLRLLRGPPPRPRWPLPLRRPRLLHRFACSEAAGLFGRPHLLQHVRESIRRYRCRRRRRRLNITGVRRRHLRRRHLRLFQRRGGSMGALRLLPGSIAGVSNRTHCNKLEHSSGHVPPLAGGSAQRQKTTEEWATGDGRTRA